MRVSKAIGVVLATLLLSGCIFAPGDSRDWDGGNGEPTLGQQLIDLKRAHEQGVLSDVEYDRTRQRLLDDVN